MLKRTQIGLNRHPAPDRRPLRRWLSQPALRWRLHLPPHRPHLHGLRVRLPLKCPTPAYYTKPSCRNIITDYLPKWRVPRWRMFFDYANLLAVFVVGWGWYEFETNDVGLTEAVKRIWRASSEKKSI